MMIHQQGESGKKKSKGKNCGKREETENFCPNDPYKTEEILKEEEEDIKFKILQSLLG
jgi:hypothetical protein